MAYLLKTLESALASGCAVATSSVRARVAMLAMIAILQRNPSVWRLLANFPQNLAPASRIAQNAAIAGAGFGSYHAVSGATMAVYQVSPEIPPMLEVGTPVAFAVGVSNIEPGQAASSWSLAGNLPPGLILADRNMNPANEQGIINDLVATIIGTPTTPGTYAFSLKPWNDENAAGDTAVALGIMVTVEEKASIASIRIWIELAGTELVTNWTAAEGKQYEVLYSTDEALSPQSWNKLDAQIEHAGGTQSITIAPDAFPSPLFIRIRASSN